MTIIAFCKIVITIAKIMAINNVIISTIIQNNLSISKIVTKIV